MDASSALQNMQNIPVSRKMRHVSVALGKAREYKRDGLLNPRKIEGKLNPSDEGTKVNTGVAHDQNFNFITNQPAVDKLWIKIRKRENYDTHDKDRHDP